MTIREDLLQSPGFVFEADVFYQKSAPKNLEFEKKYIDLRRKENRLYADEIVQALPEIPPGHPLKKEWNVRKRSVNKLLNYLKEKPGTKKILEIGCGNGWLSNQLSTLSSAEVLGLDMNEAELLQAAKVFGKKKNLTFVYADVFQTTLLSKFDYVVLASSIQYFPDLPKLIDKLLELMSAKGEIHIIDSPIYKTSAKLYAQQRSKEYFDQQDSDMHGFYFHHTWPAFTKFKTTILYDPKSIFNRLNNLIMSPHSPFPWVKITK